MTLFSISLLCRWQCIVVGFIFNWVFIIYYKSFPHSYSSCIYSYTTSPREHGNAIPLERITLLLCLSSLTLSSLEWEASITGSLWGTSTTLLLSGVLIPDTGPMSRSKSDGLSRHRPQTVSPTFCPWWMNQVWKLQCPPNDDGGDKLPWRKTKETRVKKLT